MVDRTDARMRANHLPDHGNQRGVGGFTDQQPLRFAGQQRGDCSEDEADRDRCGPIDPRIAGRMTEPDSCRSDEEPGKRRAILEQDNEGCGILRLPDRLPPAASAAPGIESPHGQRPRCPFEQEGDREYDIVYRGIAKRSRSADMDPTLVDRHARARREDEDRHHERPEIEFAAVAEGMASIGRAARPALAIEQQHLIAAVDERVNAFGRHR